MAVTRENINASDKWYWLPQDNEYDIPAAPNGKNGGKSEGTQKGITM